MNKEYYVDLMDLVLSAYSEEHIKAYTQTVIENGIEEHGYPRLVANLGFLIAHGKKQDYKDEFCKMMDLCCKEIPGAYKKNGISAGNDFSVKEIVVCLLELEKAGVYDKKITDAWRKELSAIDPYVTYTVIASYPHERVKDLTKFDTVSEYTSSDKLVKTFGVLAPATVRWANNWGAFGAASEQARIFAGIGNESCFVENQVSSQLKRFDENGMYRDPNEPMAYDYVTRLQLAIAIYLGYDGESKKALENELLKSADLTLNMQSVTGEIPYGGRSAQFLFNETMFAALSEFYAWFFNKNGDYNKAGQFKNAARLAIDSIISWLDGDNKQHVKNYYPNDSLLGCEEYAYFDKYMVTTGSWLMFAYIMSDDIEEIACPATTKNCICQTSDYFHKVLCRYNDYFVEVDTKADYAYDASGIGRVHKRGVPSALCLSVPFAENPHYKLDIKNPSDFSVCAGIKTENGYVYTYDKSTEYKLVEKTITDEYIKIKFECVVGNKAKIFKTCVVSDSGVEISASGDGEVKILFALFDYDGKTKTDINISEDSAVVSYKGSKCEYHTNGIISDMNKMYANRNGHYRAVAATKENSVSLKIQMY